MFSRLTSCINSLLATPAEHALCTGWGKEGDTFYQAPAADSPAAGQATSGIDVEPRGAARVKGSDISGRVAAPLGELLCCPTARIVLLTTAQGRSECQCAQR